MTAEVVALPGMSLCDECDCSIGRELVAGRWLCSACADQLAPAPSPARQMWRHEFDYERPSLEDLLDELTKEPG